MMRDLWQQKENKTDSLTHDQQQKNDLSLSVTGCFYFNFNENCLDRRSHEPLKSCKSLALRLHSSTEIFKVEGKQQCFSVSLTTAYGRHVTVIHSCGVAAKKEKKSLFRLQTKVREIMDPVMNSITIEMLRNNGQMEQINPDCESQYCLKSNKEQHCMLPACDFKKAAARAELKLKSCSDRQPGTTLLIFNFCCCCSECVHSKNDLTTDVTESVSIPSCGMEMFSVKSSDMLITLFATSPVPNDCQPVEDEKSISSKGYFKSDVGQNIERGETEIQLFFNQHIKNLETLQGKRRTDSKQRTS
ncbi:uncharacterized protein V6R79_010222 [Siganus canaliculatus]